MGDAGTQPYLATLFRHCKQVNNPLKLLQSLNQSRRWLSVSTRSRPLKMELKAALIFLLGHRCVSLGFRC